MRKAEQRTHRRIHQASVAPVSLNPGTDFPGGNVAERILVVDDEPDLLELVRVNLARAGFAVEIAATGREALDALSVRHPT